VSTTVTFVQDRARAAPLDNGMLAITEDSPWSDLRAGALAILPATVAVIPFALLLGALAAEKGLSPLETALMSGLVFAGSSQFVALDLWTTPAAWLALGSAALLVNLRHILMGASIAPKMDGFHPLARALALLLLADEIWAMAERRAATRRLTPAYYAGVAGLLYVNWVVFTTAGAVVGARLGDPAAYGFDFAFAAIFIGLIAGFRHTRGFLPTIVVAALAAVAARALLSGPVSIALGAAAGVAVAALLPPRRETP
jgi:predicted branched-subunit amino acid permease